MDWLDRYLNRSYQIGKIKPNTEGKAKWYYGWLSKDDDKTGQLVLVTEHGNPYFKESYSLNGSSSFYIEKTDVEIICGIEKREPVIGEEIFDGKEIRIWGSKEGDKEPKDYGIRMPVLIRPEKMTVEMTK